MFLSPIDHAFLRFQSSGNPKDLAEVFDATSSTLLEAAHHLSGDLATAEDLVQATFLSAIECKENYQPKAPVISWLFGVLVNQIKKHRRKQDRFLDPNRLRQEKMVSDPLNEMQGTELTNLVSLAIDKLPETYQPVLRLYLCSENSAREIAIGLKRPVKTVRMQITRGLEMLRKALPQSIIAGTVVLTTPVQGLSAMREAVLSKATAVAAKSSTSSSVFGLSNKAVLLSGIGTLAVALTMALSVHSDGEAMLAPDGLLTNSPTVNLTDVADEESQVAPLQSEALRSSVTPISPPPVVATSPNLHSRRLLTMNSSTNTKSFALRAWTVPAMLLGATVLFPALGSAQSLIYHHDGEDAKDGFGASVSGTSDVNQDGYADVVVGADGWDDPNPNDPNGGGTLLDAGRAYVFSGQDGSTLFTVNGENAQDQFGGSVSDAGDVNQDGYADVVVGALGWDDPNGLGGNSREGRAYVISGQDGTILWTFEGDSADDSLGTSVSGAGDINQDGYADLVVGAIGWDDPNAGGGGGHGRAYIVSGQDQSQLFTFNGENGEDFFGTSVSDAGDVNQDGYADVVIRGWWLG